MNPAPLVLDLVRHGEAAAAANGGDRMRALTPAGRRALEALARRLADRRADRPRLCSSPYRRAIESATIIAHAFTPRLEPELMPELEPERDPADALQILATTAGADHIVLVAHQPLVGRIARGLTGTEPPFRPGTLVRIECPAGITGRGRMILAIPPESDGV